MNAEKLKRLQAQVRIGGKGTPRRKKKVIHQTATTDDKKLQSSLKKLSVSTIPGIEEVNIIKDDLTVIHFNNPKAQASLSANTFAVTGHGEHKKIVEMLPEILPQLGQETVVQLRMFANSMSSNSQKQESVGVVGVVASSVADEDDVPMLVSDFDEIAKVEAASEAKPAAPKQTCNESTKAATIDSEPKNLNEGNVQNERDNNEKQIEEKAEERPNINVTSVAASANPLDSASAGKKPKKEEQSQSKEGKANAKTKKNAKGDIKSLHHEENRKVSDKTGKDIKQKDAVDENKQSQQVVKPTGVKKVTEEASLITVDKTPNCSLESIKCHPQEEIKDMGTDVMVAPLKENQTKKQDKPKEQITGKMGQIGKEIEQGKIKDQENKERENTSSTTKEIEIEMKVKKDQASMVAVSSKEERVQKQKSPLKSGGKQKAFVAVEEQAKQSSPPDNKSGALGTNILQSSNQQKFVKAITSNDIKIEEAIQGKSSSAQVINLQANEKVKIDEQEKLQEPNNENTKKEEITQACIQIDESVTKLIEATKDVVPQEQAPTKPTSQDKKPDEISSYLTSVNLQNNKNDTNTQAQGDDINSNKSQQQQPNEIKKESPEIRDKEQSKDIQKETSNEKSKQEEMPQVNTAATLDDIMAIKNESENQQPQSEPQAQQRIDDSKPTNPESLSVVENQIKPATDIIKQMVEQDHKELKIMDTSIKVSDKPIEPIEETRYSQLTEDIEVILKESVPKAQIIEVKPEANMSDILKGSAPEINQKEELTGPKAVQVTAHKPAEIKEIAAKSDDISIKTSTQNVSQIMGAEIKEPADEVLTPEPPEVKQKHTKDGDKCLKGSIEDGSQAKEVDINPKADQVHQEQVGAVEPQTIRTDNKFVEGAAPQLKDSPPRQNANKKTTPQPQEKESAKQQQNKPASGGKKGTSQSEGKRTEAPKPKQTSPVKTQHQQQAAKQPGGNASKQQGKASTGGTPTKSTENPAVAPKTGPASPQTATPPKAASPTKSVATTLTTTPVPIQSMKSPSREVGGNKSTASTGKKQNQKEGGSGNKAKQPSPKFAGTSAGAAASAGAPVEKTGKPASPLKATEPVATPPHVKNQPNAN